MKPKAGEIYERDGKQREVVGVSPIGEGYGVFWRKPGATSTKQCWCSTWEAWVSKATVARAAISD